MKKQEQKILQILSHQVYPIVKEQVFYRELMKKQERKITQELLHYVYPYDEELTSSVEVFYREFLKKHDGKIQIVHRSDRDLISDLIQNDMKIHETFKKFITITVF
jgi:hypothetical protein